MKLHLPLSLRSALLALFVGVTSVGTSQADSIKDKGYYYIWSHPTSNDGACTRQKSVSMWHDFGYVSLPSYDNPQKTVRYERVPLIGRQYMFTTVSTHSSSIDEQGDRHCKTEYTYNCNDISGDGGGKDVTWTCSKMGRVDEQYNVTNAEEEILIPGTWILAKSSHTEDAPIVFTNYGDMVVDSCRQEFLLLEPVQDGPDGPIYEISRVSYMDEYPVKSAVGAYTLHSVGFDLTVKESKSFTYKNAWTEGDGAFVNGDVDINFIELEELNFIGNEAVGNGGVIRGEKYNFTIKNVANVNFEANIAKNGAIAWRHGTVGSFSVSDVSDSVTFKNNVASSLFTSENLTFENVKLLNFVENQAKLFSNSLVSFENCEKVVFEKNVNSGSVIQEDSRAADFINCNEVVFSENCVTSQGSLFDGPGPDFTECHTIKFVDNVLKNGTVISRRSYMDEISGSVIIENNIVRYDDDVPIVDGVLFTANNISYSDGGSIYLTGVESMGDTLSISNNKALGGFYHGFVDEYIAVKNFKNIELHGNELYHTGSRCSRLLGTLYMLNVGDISIKDNVAYSCGKFGGLIGAGDTSILQDALGSEVTGFDSITITGNEIGKELDGEEYYPYIIDDFLSECTFVGKDSGDTKLSTFELSGNIVRGYATDYYNKGMTMSDVSSVTIKDNTYHAISDTGENSGTLISRANFSNIGKLTISGNKGISDSGRAYGGAVGNILNRNAGQYLRFTASDVDALILKNNSVEGAIGAYGGAIYTSRGITITNCDNVELSGNFAKSTTIADMSSQTIRDSFCPDIVSYENYGQGALGGALHACYTDGSMQAEFESSLRILNNKKFVSRGNYVTDGTTFRLQGIAALPGHRSIGDRTSAETFESMYTAYMGAAQGGSLEIYDGLFIGGNLYIGVNYEQYPERYAESDQNKGNVLFSGKYAESDLKAIKNAASAGAVTQAELDASRTFTVTGSLWIHQGQLSVADGAVLNVEQMIDLGKGGLLKISEGSTVAVSRIPEHLSYVTSCYEGTIWLDGGTLDAGVAMGATGLAGANYGVCVANGGTFKVTSPSLLRSSRLTIGANGNLDMEVNAANSTTPCLTFVAVANGAISGLGMGIGANAMWLSASTPAYLNLSTSGSLTAGDYILVHLTGDNMSNVRHVEGMNWIGGEGVSGLGAKDSLKWRTNADGTLDLVWTIGSDIVSLVRPATALTWSGGEGVWAVKAGGDANVWTGSVEDLNFYDGDTVEFNSAATVTVEGNVAPAAIVVSNADGTVTIEGTGQIQGAGKLTKTGNGTLALNTRNAYTGGTELNGGTIEVGDTYALGLGEVQLKSGKLDLGGCGVGNTIKATGGTLAGAGDYAGMLLVNGELTLDGDVSAAGGVGLVSGKISGGTIKDSLIAADGGELASTIIGSSSVTAQEGKVTISGDNSYSGGTTISGAELTVKHANALGSGAISATGTSSLIVDGVTLAPDKAISNSGTLTISGKFDGSALSEVAADDVRIDDLGVENATSGFLRTGNYTVTLVEGGTVNSSAATLSYNGTQLNLIGGVGHGVGTVDYSNYLLTGSDSATVSKITAAAGAALTGIDMQGGTLTVDESTNLITATAGSIALTGGTMGGSIGGTTVVTVSGDATISGANSYTGGTTISGAELTITNASALGSGAIVTNGTSALTIGSGVTLVLTDAITNSGNLSLSGNFNIDALKPSGEVPSVRVALDGTEGESGFVKTAGYSLQVVSGGSVIDDAATISHNGKTVELDGAGVAIIEGGINYTQYHIASGHSAGVSDITAAATAEGVTLAGISLAEGGTLNADASVELTADGGTIDLSAGTLSGTLKDVQLAATAGEITGTFSGTKSTLTGSNFVLGSTALKNDGTLALNGSFVADALSSELTNVDVLVDENGTAGGTSGFLRTGDFTVTLVEGGTVNSSSAAVQYKGQQLEMSGGVGFGVGTVDYSNYLLTGSDSATVSKITAAAGAALTGIDMQGGTLTVDESTDLITATAGSIALTGGTMGGFIGGTTVVTVSGDATISGANSYTGGTTISGAELTITNASALGSGAIASNGTSTLTIGSGVTLALTEAVTNSGDLSLSGNFNIDALSSMGEIPSVRVNLSGVEGESGFLKTGSYNVQVVQGGTVNDDAATITRNDVAVTLDDSGVAFIEGRTDFTQYHVASGHEVDVQSVIDKASAEGFSLQDMSVTDGGTLNVNASMAVTSDGGRINLSSGTLSGAVGGSTNVDVVGTATISGGHSYTGGTSLTAGALTVDHAESLGTGAVASSGISSLTMADGVALALRQVITQAADGELTITGGVDAGALTLERTNSDKRVNLDGEDVEGNQSGFDKDVTYSVQIVEGGKTLGAAAVVKHGGYTGPAQFVLQEDGLATTGTIDVDYSDFFVTDGDSVNAGDIVNAAGDNRTQLDDIHMEEGSKLVVDADVNVESTGGEIELESGNTLTGNLKDTDIITVPGDGESRIEANISGDSHLVISGGSTTISGESTFSGGTSVSDEAELVVESASSLGSGDVDVMSSTIDLSAATDVENTVLLSGISTVRGADNARDFVLMKGAVTSFEGGFILDEDKQLSVRNHKVNTFSFRSMRSGDVTIYKGALTLAGGTLSLDSMLKVEGKVTFMAGRKTLVDISGWDGAGDGTTLADFGSDNTGYTKGCLTLRGIAGNYELLFDESTGLLTLGLIPEEEKQPVTPPDVMPEPEELPVLNNNQSAVYTALSSMIADGSLQGELREMVEAALSSGDGEAIKAMLDQLSGAEYAAMMGSQIDGNTAHLSYLRRMAGSGWELVGNAYTRAYIEMFTNDSNLNGDAHGRGYDRTEMGGQFALEFIGCKHMSSGIAVAASRTRLQADGGIRQHTENVYADAYTMFRGDNGYNAIFSAGVGIHEHDLGRNVNGSRTKATADGLSFNFMHESAVDMKIDETNKVQLFASVESSWNDIDTFREKGAGSASLVGDDQQAWATDVTLGARYTHRFVAFHYGPAASLTLEAGVIASVGDIASDVDMHFAGAADKEFSVRSAKRNRWGYNVGASFHLPMSPFSALQVGGEATLRGDSCDWNANVGFQIAF